MLCTDEQGPNPEADSVRSSVSGSESDDGEPDDISCFKLKFIIYIIIVSKFFGISVP
jgi:hypothetical protein